MFIIIYLISFWIHWLYSGAQNIDVPTGNSECFCPNVPIVFTATDLSDEIASPVSPVTYNYCENMRCQWDIKPGPPGTAISLTFDVFETELQNDKFEVFLKESSPEQDGVYNLYKLFQLSGRHWPPQLPLYTFNTTETIQIVFSTDWYNQDRGFEAQFQRYNISENSCTCPQTMYRLSDANKEFTLTSPNYPEQYCYRSRCHYLIIAEENKGIRLNFTDFELEESDYIEIFEGKTTDLVNSAKFTQTLKEDQKIYNSTGSELLMVFNTDVGENNKGFKAIVSQFTKTCSCESIATFTKSTSGSITSPGFKEGFLCANINCSYGVEVEDGSVVQLKIYLMDLHEGDSLCLYYDTDDIRGRPVICWIGHIDQSLHEKDPEIFTTDSSKVTLVLKTVHDRKEMVHKGFNLSYAAKQRSQECACHYPHPVTIMDKAGQIASSECGPKDCLFLFDPALQPHQRDVFSFTVDHLNIPVEKKDYLALHRGQFNNQHKTFLLKTYSNSIKNGTGRVEHLSVDGPLTLHYHLGSGEGKTSDANQGLLFSFLWEPQDCSCGVMIRNALMEKNQSLTSPGFLKHTYCEDLRCPWELSAPSGHRVVVNVTYLDLAQPGDVLEFYDGEVIDQMKDQDKLLAVMTGRLDNYVTKVFFTSQPKMTILLVTDGSMEKMGFNITYFAESLYVNRNYGIGSTVSPPVPISPIVDQGEILRPRINWLPIVVTILIILVVIGVVAWFIYRSKKRNSEESARIGASRGDNPVYYENRCYDNSEVNGVTEESRHI